LKTLIFVPTYNERNNVGRMADELLGLGLDADLLFMDDNSPDGTGDILDRLGQQHDRLFVLHRRGKLGIGSAHLDGISWAYDHGYERLVTLDCDFTHKPADVLRVIEHLKGYALATGSRYMQTNSLPGWNPLRKSLTALGHGLTKHLLGIRYDATGALRAYDLRRIPHEVFERVTAQGYAFFFESMFVLVHNGFSVNEFPIVLPARTYDTSKMTLRETWRSGSHLLSVWMTSKTNPDRFRVVRCSPTIEAGLVDSQGWDAYWNRKERPSGRAYELIAATYRVSVIKKQLERVILRHFSEGSELLHAGCGSGQVDAGLQARMNITAVDISPSALQLYQQNNPSAFAVRHATILDLPFRPCSFDGAYNLGVLEHFTPEEIQQILAQLHRVIKPGGKLVVFWPHSRATSVAALRLAHWIMNDVMRKPTVFHPPEVSLLRSRKWVEALVRQAGFQLADYSFGPRDLFVQAVVVAEKPLAG
jgi:dolichol-phosphate mannosyltransferase